MWLIAGRVCHSRTHAQARRPGRRHITRGLTRRLDCALGDARLAAARLLGYARRCNAMGRSTPPAGGRLSRTEHCRRLPGWAGEASTRAASASAAANSAATARAANSRARAQERHWRHLAACRRTFGPGGPGPDDGLVEPPLPTALSNLEAALGLGGEGRDATK